MATIDTTSSASTAVSTPASSVTLFARASERRVVIGIIVLVLLMTTALFVFANVSAPADRQFMGIALNAADHVQYFSWMRDLSSAPLASVRLTPEPNAPAYFNLLWWALGNFGRLTGLDYAASFSLLRFVAAAFVLACAYGFVRLTVVDTAQRRIAFFLAAFGGGLGVVWVVVKYLTGRSNSASLFPFDLFTVEHNTFLQTLAFPHFALALGLVIATFGLVLIALRQRKLRYAVAAGLVALILGLQHAYDLVTVYAVLGLFGALTWVRDRKFPTFLFACGVIVVALSIPPAAYAFLLVSADPVWRAVFSQFDLAGAFTPDPLHLPILLGVPFVLALAAFRPRMLRSRTDVELFVGAWFVSHFVLIYLPVDFQIHLLLGWQIPIAILAAGALVTRVGPWLARATRLHANAVTAAVLALCVVTNAYLYAWRFVELGRHEEPYYLRADEVAALTWLERNVTQADVVLADLRFGQYVPTWTDARAFLAHWTGTLDYNGKRELATKVLSSETAEADRRAILSRYGVTYVVVDARAHPDTAFDASYAAAFAQGAVTVYRAP